MAVQKEQIIFEGKTASLDNAIKDVQNSLSKLELKVNETSNKVDNSFKKIGKSSIKLTEAIRGLSGVLSVTALAALGRHAIETSDAIDKTAKKLGITVEELQKLNFAASQNSVSQEKMADALKAIQNRSQLATNGMNEYRRNFIKLGIDVNKFNELGLEEKFKVIAERMKEIKDPGQKVAIAMSVLGDSGKDLIPILKDGAAGVEKYGIEAKKAGLIISKDMIDKNVKMGDELDKMSKKFNALAASITSFVAPAFNIVLDGLSKMATGFSIVGKGLEAWILKEMSIDAKGINVLLHAGSKIPVIGDHFKSLSKDVSVFDRNMAAASRETLKELMKYGKGVHHVATTIERKTKVNKKLAEAIKSVVAPQAELTKEFKKTDVAAASAAKKEALLALSGKDLADTLTGKTSPSLKRFNQDMAKLNAALKAGSISQEEFSKASAKLKKNFDLLNTDAGRRMKQMQDFAKSAASEMQSSFENGFFNAMQGKFSGLLDSFTQTLDRMVAKALATDLANSLGLGPKGGAGTNLLGSLIGGNGGGSNIFSSIGGLFGGGSGGGLFDSLTSGISNFFGGFFADGGNVSAGRPILVGENGPEIFRPKQAGQIIPNAGGKNVVVNMTVNATDANSFRQSHSQIIAEIAQGINSANSRDL